MLVPAGFYMCGLPEVDEDGKISTGPVKCQACDKGIIWG
jgi:hypothetical protein